MTDRTKIYGSASLAVSVIGTVNYVVLIAQQDDNSWVVVAAWIFVMLVIIVSTALATWARNRPPISFATPIVLAIVIGILGIFSIGVPFLVAALLAFIASRQTTG